MCEKGVTLPANAELGHDDRVELARPFAIDHLVSRSLAVQPDVHSPHGAESEEEQANYHAYLRLRRDVWKRTALQRRRRVQAARGPKHVLGVLTRNQASFSQYHLYRHLKKQIRDESERSEIKASVLAREIYSRCMTGRQEMARRALDDADCAYQEVLALADGRQVVGGSHRNLEDVAKQRVTAAGGPACGVRSCDGFGRAENRRRTCGYRQEFCSRLDP